MKIEDRFSRQELEQIGNAVKDAETGISGEIVPVFTERSDVYQYAILKAGSIFSLLMFAVLVIFDHWVPGFRLYDPVAYLALVLAVGSLSALLTWTIPAVRRLFISSAEMNLRCLHKAERLFLEEEVFNTDKRTGIMIFISFFERKAIVLADKGITEVTPQEEWDHVISDLIVNIRAGNKTEGILKAIEDCGIILSQRKSLMEDPSGNELSNLPRLK